MKKNINNNGKIAAGIGAGVALTALAAAGAYFLSGPEGKKRQAKMKSWAVKAQKEVAKNVKVAQKLGETEYNRIVDKAVEQYGAMSSVTPAEVAKVAKEIKSEWKRIQSHAKKISKDLEAKGKKVVAKRSVVKKA
jgi:predicted methyltransferase